MAFEAVVGIVTGSAIGALLVYEMWLAGPTRALRAKPHPQAVATLACVRCGRPSSFSAQTTSSNDESSTDLILYCSGCGADDWQVLKPARHA